MGNNCSRAYLCVDEVICETCCEVDGDVWRHSIQHENDVNIFAAALIPWPYFCYTCTNLYRVRDDDNCCVGLAACVTCPVPCLMLPFFRYWTRVAYGVKGSACNDFFQSWFCYSCTLRVVNETLSRPVSVSKTEITVPILSKHIEGILEKHNKIFDQL